MSCHTPGGNPAVLGYCAATYGLDSESVESEFHWLKRVGRDKQAPPVSDQAWSAFVDQQQSWITHDPRLTDARRARLLEHIAIAREMPTPDAPTFYALQNLPSRLTYVTDPETLRATMSKVQTYTDAAASNAYGEPEHLREAVLHLRRAEAALTRTGNPNPEDLPVDVDSLIDEATASAETLDVYLDPTGHATSATPDREYLYQSHRWMATALRHLKRI